MNTELFIKLTDAYGATINHWPEIYQKLANEVISLNLPEVNEALEKARLLDEMLNSQTLAPAESALFENIVASASRADISRIKQSFWQQWHIKSWLGVSGFIGTGLAGAVAGAFFVSTWSSGMQPESFDGASESSSAMAQYVDIGQE